MYRLIGFLVVLVFLTGCKTTLKSNWKNFNAYYNTYYNAQESFNAGLKKNLGQSREYNPLQPIRIHEKPVNAGTQDFEKAIEKGADILRKYDDTKWVDNSLFLIGKSYYFNQEYFSADQKFKELFATTENPELQQQAIIWQGRTLLDLELYSEGIAFLSEEITLFDDTWSNRNKAEVKALLAQHYVKQGNWEMARQELSEAIRDLPQKNYKERGYFLLGQLSEYLEDIPAAFEAYDKVQDHYTEYRLQYLAKRKTAEVARDLERHDVAYSLFNDMVRDDKNLEYKAELDFELARTEQQRGNFRQAEKVYKNLLRNPLNRPSAEIAARTYYGLAEIYRYNYDNFSMAASYYDSAAQRNVPAERLPEGFMASELSESFGEYARIKSEIALKDSLLWLGQLPPAEFDAVIEELREKKAAELEELRKQNESQQNRVIVQQETEEADATSLRNGFLNSDNPILQQNAKLQFLAVWGERPLADNWRVSSMISLSGSGSDEEAENAEELLGSSNDERLMVEIDLSGIPFTEYEQDSVRKYIATHQYQLGNLFFLSLNMPDSAAHYFEKAYNSPSQKNINVVSLYSLSELYSIEGDEGKSRAYAEELITKYPSTEYASRLAEKFEIDLSVIDESEAVDPRQLYQNISERDTLSSEKKAEKLEQFAQNFSSHEIAPKAQYDAIQLYMKLGKQDSLYKDKMESWIEENERWEEKQEAFKVEQDSAQAMLQDTTISEEEREEINALLDSTLTHPDFTLIFPYTGAFWDSARSAIDVFLDTFPGSDYSNRVRRLQDELEVSADRLTDMEKAEETNPEAVEVEDSEYLNCKDVGETVEIRGGMNRFMDTVELPDEITNEAEISEVSYVFLINQRGIIDDYSVTSEDIPSEITEALESAFENSLSFEPLLQEGQAVPVRCEIIFPLESSN